MKPVPPAYQLNETLQASERSLMYRGQRCSDGGPVVLKVLGPLHAQASDVERLEREFEIAGAVRGSATMKPLGLDRFHGLPTLVLEDFSGKPLRVLLVGRALDVERALRVAVPLAAAVAEVHHSGVIHRDINPDNIIVDEATGEVKLTEFGFATVLPREQPMARNPALIEGTLAYISPEQTGRMNRMVDARTDLYSLGVTLFEILTGRLPFVANDALEWVHCHVARQPPVPRDLVPGLPDVLSHIVLKLLAKAAEDRYQSADGVRYDLERCLSEWQQLGHITPFVIAQQDRIDRLAMPQRLYGREHDIAQLAEAFSRVTASRQTELVLVTGCAGIGKSALVQELQGPVVRQRGLFLAGKFDQHKRNVPYAAIVQAYRELILDILTESDEQVAVWRQRLGGALGPNARLITDVIPQLGLILGPQPPVPTLPPTEAQQRFALTLQRFVGAFPATDRPVVLFLDDMQWADGASLSLIEQLANSPETGSLLLVGAYRDNEVGPSHPVAQTVANLRRCGVLVREVQPAPFDDRDMQALARDMFRCDEMRAGPFARIIRERTGGNPFFTLQFIATLDQEGLVSRDRGTGAWLWDLDKIAARQTTSNVVDFMVERVKQLPPALQRLLTQASCTGDAQDLDLLAAFCRLSPLELERQVIDLAREGMFIRLGGRYRFAHDRIRQAAYLLIPEGERPVGHLQIGRLLLQRSSPEEQDELAFDIVNHLNLAASLIVDPTERVALAALNLKVGCKAKASNAHAGAIDHLAMGIKLLGPDPWTQHPHLAYGLELALAECELVTGEIDRALERGVRITEQSLDQSAKVPALMLLKDAHLANGRPTNAVACELAALALFGIELPARPSETDVAEARARVTALLRDRNIEDIADLPALSDAKLELAMTTTSSASFTDKNLYLVHAARMVALSLEHGNAEGSVFWYGSYGYILASLGECRDGHRFAKAAHALCQRRGFSSHAQGSAHFFLSLTSFWTESLEQSRAHTRAALTNWLDAGSFTGAALAAFNRVYGSMVAGEQLDDVRAQLDETLDLLRRIHFRDVEDMCLLLGQLVKALQGQTRGLMSLSDEKFDAEAFAHGLTESRLRRVICWYWLVWLRLHFLAGDFRAALAAAENATAAGWSLAGTMPARDLALYHALTLAALFDEGSFQQREQWNVTLLEYQEQFRRWAEINPATFGHNYTLISAEIARITACNQQAAELYRESIKRAAEGGFVADETLAYELAARWREAQGPGAMVDLLNREACSRYRRWGAAGKVKQIEARYRELPDHAPAVRSSLLAPGLLTPDLDHIDLSSVLRASQAISREVVFERLVRTLMETSLAQSGAERSALLLVRDGTLSIAAEATVVGGGTLVTMAPAAAPTSMSAAVLPETIVRFVLRTGQSIVLDDATEERRFGGDKYIARAKPRSVLCLPIVKQGDITGLLYLENNAVSAAFTPDRLAVLEVLAAQMAISLENSELFRKLTGEIEERKRAEAKLRFLAEAGTTLTESLDYGATMAKVARSAVAFLADWCLVDVLEQSGAIRSVTASHRDPSREEVLSQLRDHRDKQGPPVHTLELIRKGSTLLLPQPNDAEVGKYLAGPQAQHLLQQLGHDSAMVVPLRARDRVLGSMSFVASERRDKRYDLPDLALAEELARRAAVAIDNAILFQEAQQAIKLRDEFLSIASHELNTPIASLLLMVQGLQAEVVGLPAHLAKPLGTVVRQTRRLAHLVDELLNVSRIHAGQLHLHLEMVDLAAVVADVTERLSDEARAARCPLRIRAVPSVIGRWDRTRLEQILTNLLSNALKFGQGKPIDVMLEQGDDIAKLVVADQGIGLSKQDSTRIFERFSRAVSAEHYGGLGLGLFIVSEIVRSHQGTVNVVSDVGAGTTFTVELPKGPATPI